MISIVLRCPKPSCEYVNQRLEFVQDALDAAPALLLRFRGLVHLLPRLNAIVEAAPKASASRTALANFEFVYILSSPWITTQ